MTIFMKNFKCARWRIKNNINQRTPILFDVILVFFFSCSIGLARLSRRLPLEKLVKILCFFGHSFELIFAQINNMKSRIIGIIHVRCSCFFSIFPKTKIWTSKIYFLFCEQKKFYFDAVADINSYSINDFIEILKIFLKILAQKQRYLDIEPYLSV